MTQCFVHFIGCGFSAGFLVLGMFIIDVIFINFVMTVMIVVAVIIHH